MPAIESAKQILYNKLKSAEFLLRFLKYSKPHITETYVIYETQTL